MRVSLTYFNKNCSHYLKNLSMRKLAEYKVKTQQDIKQNNRTLLKYLIFEMKSFDSHISELLKKLKVFIDDINLSEAMGFLGSIFSESVS